MIIENVYLNNFTSFKDCYITFSDKINIFVGDDDNAKIDLLKAIYCLDEKFYINKKEGEIYSIASEENFPFSSITSLAGKYLALNVWRIIFNEYIHFVPFNIITDENFTADSTIDKNSIITSFDIHVKNKNAFPINKKFIYTSKNIELENIDKESILLFDGLDYNFTDDFINMLLELSKMGVQIFIASNSNSAFQNFQSNNNIKLHYFNFDEKNGIIVK